MEQHPGKHFAVQLSVDLIPDGIGYEVRQPPEISIIEIDAQGQRVESVESTLVLPHVDVETWEEEVY